jgi:hypothetical protein
VIKILKRCLFPFARLKMVPSVLVEFLSHYLSSPSKPENIFCQYPNAKPKKKWSGYRLLLLEERRKECRSF